MVDNIYGIYIISQEREDINDKGIKVVTRMVITTLKTIDRDYYITYREIRKKWFIFSYWAKIINNAERASVFNSAGRATQHCIDKGYSLIKEK